MSYSTWHDYGYGICIDDLNEFTFEQLYELICMSPVVKKDFDDWLGEEKIDLNEDGYGVANDYSDDRNDSNGVADILRDVIFQNEAIQLYTCRDYDDGIYLMFRECLPWQCNSKEKNLTVEELEKIIKKYCAVLGTDNIECDFIECENGG